MNNIYYISTLMPGVPAAEEPYRGGHWSLVRGRAGGLQMGADRRALRQQVRVITEILLSM